MTIYDKDYLSGYGDLFLAIDRFAFEPSQKSEDISSMEYLPTVMPIGNKLNIANFTRSSLPWIDYRLFVNRTSNSDQAFNGSWPDDARVAQALATVINRQNRIELSLDFMATVIGCNLLKLLVMLWVLFTDRSEYLVTIGDAVASFLRDPDHCTANSCMLDKGTLIYRAGQKEAPLSQTSAKAPTQERLYDVWQPTGLRYSESLSDDREIFFLVL
jgi:hypothetical protein